MSYYGDYRITNYHRCENYKRGRQNQGDYEGAYMNSQSKHLQMKPCIFTNNCRGYTFAGADSGNNQFCYNFEEKKMLLDKLRGG